MPRKKTKTAKAVSFNPVDLANAAKSNPYVQRLIEDADLRENLQKALDASRSAYHRLSNGKAPQKAILEDKKLQKDVRQAFEAIREASTALAEAPKRRARKGLTVGRSLAIAAFGGALALAGSEQLRSKVLDTLFGKEEEFEYTPPVSTSPTPPATPVSSA